jgi:hypothetical protein
MNEIMEFLKGKKTYLIAIAVVVLGALQGLEVFIVPEWAWPILGAVGLGTLRAGVDKVDKVVKEQTADGS